MCVFFFLLLKTFSPNYFCKILCGKTNDFKWVLCLKTMLFLLEAIFYRKIKPKKNFKQIKIHVNVISVWHCSYQKKKNFLMTAKIKLSHHVGQREREWETVAKSALWNLRVAFRLTKFSNKIICKFFVFESCNNFVADGTVQAYHLQWTVWIWQCYANESSNLLNNEFKIYAEWTVHWGSSF